MSKPGLQVKCISFASQECVYDVGLSEIFIYDFAIRLNLKINYTHKTGDETKIKSNMSRHNNI